MIKRYCFLFLLLLSIFSKLHAQLCQGSLGDPIINITFGAGSNPGPPIKAAGTGYKFVNFDCPNDGFYAIRNSTVSCFGSWHTINRDHTGDANGYFMVVNATNLPGDFYLDTVKGLCPNSTYEFASWIMNIISASSCGGNSILPNVTFKIEKTDGTLLQQYNTGNIAVTSTPQWKQYGFFFTTPIGISDIVLRMTNNSPGGCGNDIALDDITFRPCGPQLTPSVTGTTDVLKEFCEGTATTVNLSCIVSAGYNNPYFQWQQSTDNGITWTDIAAANTTTLVRNFPASARAGNYLFRLTAAEATNAAIASCRIASAILTVRINAGPVPVTTATTPVCEGAVLMLQSSGGTNYEWTGPANFSASSPSPVSISNIKQTQTGKYYVKAITAAGCSKMDSITVIVNPKPVAMVSSSSVSLCKGDSISLTASGGSSYSWSPLTGLSSVSIANPKVSPADTLLYMVEVANSFSCKDTAYTTMNVIHKPQVYAGNDTFMIQGQPILLTGQIAGSHAGFKWLPDYFISSTATLQTTVNPPYDTAYILSANAINGCGVVNDTVHIRVIKRIVIPNTFSPNGDGVNEVWNIDALMAYQGHSVMVFNRGGQPVFKSNNYGKPWDGTFNGNPLPVGTYYYIITINYGRQTFSGWVQIIK